MGDSNIGFNAPSLFRKRRRVTDHAPSLSRDLPSFLPPSPLDASHLPVDQSDGRPTTAFRTRAPLGSPPTYSPPKHGHRRESSLSSLSELKSSFRRRSASLRTKRAESPTPWEKLATYYDQRSFNTAKPPLNVPTLSSTPSSDSLASPPKTSAGLISANDRTRAFPSGRGIKREDSSRPGTSLGVASATPASRSVSSSSAGGNAHEPRILIRRIHEAASKRISLLNYLRMIHASETHWFNTYRFSPSQIRALPSMAPSRLAKRTQSLLLLGLSLPFVLDPNSDSLPDYLRTFYALLVEFETYNTFHPTDGSSTSALSRARIPQMFKRGGVSKARHSSSADPNISSPQEDPRSAGSGSMNNAGIPTATWTSLSNTGPDGELAPGEDYQFLLTPSLPFELDYYETFATLCDVLRDCYKRVMVLLGPAEGPWENTAGLQGLTELFSKVDAKIKKIVMAGLVREFEDASRQGIRSELAGVGKLVLGGLV